ncbi:Hypothetical protein zj316_2028 [Lactiplantibacillus plantarum ZJ316]|nr:Hypothetical protein zj316_2028 [Lactiplantibacillus plantarum ZJ316]
MIFNYFSNGFIAVFKCGRAVSLYYSYDFIKVLKAWLKVSTTASLVG